jgi:hypothetical protein
MPDRLRSQPFSPLAGWRTRSRLDRLIGRVVDAAVNGGHAASGFAAADRSESPGAAGDTK